MLVAELELFLSRPIAPTRRVALGERQLPTDPSPGHGGLLLGAVVAANIGSVDPELRPDIHRLTRQLEIGSRIAQPRLRHRYQQDRVGLSSHRHRLLVDSGRLRLDLAEAVRPAPHVLGALYAAGQIPVAQRGPVFELLRRALLWRGSTGPDLLDHLSGARPGQWIETGEAPRAWALAELGLGDSRPEPDVVQRRFRELLRLAHPDHGGEADAAAGRIENLTRARRILLTD